MSKLIANKRLTPLFAFLATLAILLSAVLAITGTASAQVSDAPDRAQQLKNKITAFEKKRDSLLDGMMERHKLFYVSYLQFFNEQKQLRQKRENDLFIPFTDVHVPPSELFEEKLLVARHSRLCLGETMANRVSFHPCNVNTGGLLWATRNVFFNNFTQSITNKRVHIEEHEHDIGSGSFKMKFKSVDVLPNPEYVQLQHNGACLTTPFHLADNSENARAAHLKELMTVARSYPTKSNAYLTLKSCRQDGKGQLWKVIKETHNSSDNHGFSIMERESGFCLRPETVKTQLNSKTQDVHAVFYPCNGTAHQTFEMFAPNNSMPIWYDHNGVIKSDNDLCLDVPESMAEARNEGTEVFMKACTNDQTDRWDYSVEYDKTVKINNDYTGYCLYPYDKAEGAIPATKQGQLVQRPCDARFGQGWKLRLIPKSDYFQLEALDSRNRATGKCMIPDKPNPKSGKVAVNVGSCKPATRGRWKFGHWEGQFEWTLWNIQNSGQDATTLNDLSRIYWIDQESLKNRNANGVCRVISGRHDRSNSYNVIPGTWDGKTNACRYVDQDGKKAVFRPDEDTFVDSKMEILTGLDVGTATASGQWVNSANGVPHDSRGEAHHPPKPAFSPFITGGVPQNPVYFLCRQRNQSDEQWYYGHQTDGQACRTLSVSNSATQMLIFKNNTK